MANTQLEGGIENRIYIWHSNGCACTRCQELDGSVYYSEKEIPDKPHPNCKCYIEVVQDDICDCLNDMLTEIDNLIGDANVLQSEIYSGISSFTDLITNKKCTPSLIAAIESCIDALQQISGTVADFIRNYNDMKAADTIGGDKYFHSKANCDAAQRGKLASFVAKGICDLREYTDTYKNILIKGMTLAESLQDSKEDQDANVYGREQGTKYPEIESRILIDKYRPNGLPNKY